MKTIAALSLFAASASAFTTVQQPSASSSVALQASRLDGAWGTTQETFGKCPPLGAMILENVGPKGDMWFQTSEIKHGRVAMLGHWCRRIEFDSFNTNDQAGIPAVNSIPQATEAKIQSFQPDGMRRQRILLTKTVE